MLRRLDTAKAIQAVGVVLRREGKRSGRLRLLKLLYIADRKCLAETGAFLLGSKFVAMKHGPLHSEVLDLINGWHLGEPDWSQYFRTDGRWITLESEPEVGRLSRHEVELLNSVADEHAGKDDWEIVEYTHAFDEWKKNYPNLAEDTSKLIPLEDVIDATGRTADKQAILQDLNDEAAYDGFFEELRGATKE